MQCYKIPASPLPMLLPIECIAEVVAKPDITPLQDTRAKWMCGHVTWSNHRLPVLSYSVLHNAELDESKKSKAKLVVLNPVPNAVRKAYAAILCFGDVETLEVDDSLVYTDIDETVDRRYVEAVVEFSGQRYLIPKLTSLAVAFSYF